MRTFLRAGFGVVILLMGISVALAYRFITVSGEDTSPACERYSKEEQNVEGLRRHLAGLTSNAKDFFYDRRPHSAAVYRERLQNHKVEAAETLKSLGARSLTGLPLAPISAKLTEYFDVMAIPIPWSARMREEREDDFFKLQVAPHRNAARKSIDAVVNADKDARAAIVAEAAGRRTAAMRNLLLSLTLSLLCAFVVGGVSLLYVRDLERASALKYEELINAHGDMEQLSARLLRVQEEERRSLSRELHDGLGQTLTALRIEISHAETRGAPLEAETRERLQRARALTDDAVRTTRDISLLLRPPLLDELGLEPALRWQAEEFTVRHGTPCDFSAIGLQDHPADAWKICVYRVVQEALHNCLKHAAPTRVRIRARQEDGQLTVEVEDDGCGFELNGKGTPAKTAGLGILGMRERAVMLGGELKMQSSPGRGTKLTLRLPLATISNAAPVAAWDRRS